MNHIITHFACTVPHLLEVKLDKLIYIAHLYHFSEYEERLTDVRFFSLSFGPHAPIIRSIIGELDNSGMIYLRNARTSEDPVYSNPCKVITAKDDTRSRLPVSWQKTLAAVQKEWGNKRFEDILDYTTRTIPFLSTNYRMQIDWNKIPVFQGLKSVLSLEQRERIHKFIAQPAAQPVYINCHGKQTCLVSAHDIAEVYLAIRGNDPGEMPSKDSLGFDIEAVVSALIGLDRMHKNENKKGEVIDTAARLAGSLLNSLSFKNYTGRVALMVGLLLLKRYGYSFNGENLETTWPEGNNFESFRKWFGKMSFKSEGG